ncbi:MAG: type II secretion system minor pseudopilin GspH [Legionellales bacterium]
MIGVTIGFALLAFGDFGQGRRILFAAEQLVNTLKLAQQQAILDTSTLGLRIDNTSYQILQFQNTSQWEPLSNKGVFKTIYFPAHTVINLKTNTTGKTYDPAIIINSSGDMTPFTLSFGSSTEPVITTLVGRPNGSLTLTSVQTQ